MKELPNESFLMNAVPDCVEESCTEIARLFRELE